MDHQPLNTGEQKDMAEFFIDLVSKLEEMTPELKNLVKTLFGGMISNNVVSLVSALCANILVALQFIPELSLITYCLFCAFAYQRHKFCVVLLYCMCSQPIVMLILKMKMAAQ
jgi:hypothetical protein